MWAGPVTCFSVSGYGKGDEMSRLRIILQKTAPAPPFLVSIFSLAGLDEAGGHVGRLKWQGIENNLSQQAGRKRRWPLASNSQQQDPQFYRLKDLSSANNRMNLERVPFIEP